jgi:hypothetical protein
MKPDSRLAKMKDLISTNLLVVPMFVASLLLVSGCFAKPGASSKHQDISQTSTETEKQFNGRIKIATEVKIQNQYSDEIRHLISADEISVNPRAFAAFNINSINELLIENAHIEIFPSTASDTDSGATSDWDEDFVDTLRDFAETLPDEYGVVSRLNIENVHITLHGAGEEGSYIRVNAKKLVKEFRDGSYPDLYDVNFYNGGSAVGLNVSHVLWNTKEGKFMVKSRGVPEKL